MALAEVRQVAVGSIKYVMFQRDNVAVRPVVSYFLRGFLHGAKRCHVEAVSLIKKNVIMLRGNPFPEPLSGERNLRQNIRSDPSAACAQSAAQIVLKIIRHIGRKNAARRMCVVLWG